MHEATWDTGVKVHLLRAWTMDEGEEIVSIYADAESALEAMLVEVTELVAQEQDEDWTAYSVLDPGYREQAERLAAEKGGMDKDGDFFLDLLNEDGFGNVYTVVAESVLRKPE